ncbi:MAG: gluconate 2-dehydrogenase subunit 3 family protein [Halioglobus sp.]|nr:gluconate 2-dehydrogenase subunit 3 family protein [Halioglobus sp.]
MNSMLSRRGFLRLGTAFGTGLVLSANSPRPLAAAAAAASGAPEIFSAGQWATIEAMTSCIIPTDHEPGALEANCVNFIDKALAREDAALLPTYRAGITAFIEESQAHFGKPFAQLRVDNRNRLLSALEQGDTLSWPQNLAATPQLFLHTVIVHTLIGFLADPGYGGNRGYAGWQVVGYPGTEHHMGGYSKEQVEGTAPVIPMWKTDRSG